MRVHRFLGGLALALALTPPSRGDDAAPPAPPAPAPPAPAVSPSPSPVAAAAADPTGEFAERVAAAVVEAIRRAPPPAAAPAPAASPQAGYYPAPAPAPQGTAALVVPASYAAPAPVAATLSYPGPVGRAVGTLGEKLAKHKMAVLRVPIPPAPAVTTAAVIPLPPLPAQAAAPVSAPAPVYATPQGAAVPGSHLFSFFRR